MRPLILLILPVVAAGMALWTGRLPLKLAVAGACGAIVAGIVLRRRSTYQLCLWAVPLAFVMSMVGDYFLSSRKGHPHYFEAGIGAFFIAHLGFLRYALANGKLHATTLAAMLVVFVPYYFLGLWPAISENVLRAAVLLYLLVSCIGFAAAVGLKQPAQVRWLYMGGIALIVFSDTIISFSEFLHYRGLNFLILPTYYMAHIAITASILLRPELDRVFVRSTNTASPHVSYPK